MFETNPFAELSVTFITPEVMQMYLIVMAVLVAGGTILDMMHKKSAKYFFSRFRKSKEKCETYCGYW